MCDRIRAYGRDAPAFAATLDSAAVQNSVVETLDRAVPAALAAAQAQSADVVLLSPACASFDQYTGFEARGDHFRALVHDMMTQLGEAA